MIFQRFSQNKYKRKRENRCHVTLKPLKGGRANGFGSLRSLNNWFCGIGRKNEFGPKLREAGRIFFPFSSSRPRVQTSYSPKSKLLKKVQEFICK